MCVCVHINIIISENTSLDETNCVQSWNLKLIKTEKLKIRFNPGNIIRVITEFQFYYLISNYN